MKTNRLKGITDAKQRKAHEKWLAQVAERQKIFGANIVEHLKEAQRLEENTRRYFQGSEFWRALQKHIEQSDDCIVERPGVVRNHSASSGVSFKDASAPWCREGEEQNISLQIEVEFVPHEDDPGYGTYQVGGPGTRQSFFIYYPADLEINFTKEKFNIWLNQQRKVRDERRLEKDQATIKRLLNQCPGLLTKMVREHEREKKANRS